MIDCIKCKTIICKFAQANPTFPHLFTSSDYEKDTDSTAHIRAFFVEFLFKCTVFL